MSNYVYKNLVRNRKNFFFIMIFSILITLFTVTLNFYQSYKKMINDGLKNDLLYRNILLAPVDKYGKQIQDIESLIKIDHIVDIHDIKYDSIDLYAKEYKNKNHEGIIEFSYGVESIKSIIGKSKISSGELICSKNFYPSFELAKNRKFFYNEEILNKSITIEEPIYRRVSGKYKDTKMKYVKTFKVAGLYDPVVTGSTLNTCYATNEDMKEIYDTLYIDLNPDSLTSYVVTVDKYENVKEVIKSLKNRNYVVNTQVVNDSTLYNKIKFISTITMISIIIIFLLISFFYIKKTTIDSSKELNLLKYIGIENEKILKMETTKILMLLLFGYFSGSLLYILVVSAIKISLHDYLMFNSYVVNYKLWLLIASIPYIIIAYLLAHVLISKYVTRDNKKWL